MKGAPGTFKLFFQTGKIKSVKTTTFELSNPVHEVAWLPAGATSYEKDSSGGGASRWGWGGELWKLSGIFGRKLKTPYLQSTIDGTLLEGVAAMPRVMLLDEHGHPAEAPIGNVEVRFVTYLNTTLLDTTIATGRSSLDNAKSLKDNFAKMTPVDQLKTVFSLLMQGGRKLNVLPIPKAKMSACWSKCNGASKQEDCAKLSFCKWSFEVDPTQGQTRCQPLEARPKSKLAGFNVNSCPEDKWYPSTGPHEFVQDASGAHSILQVGNSRTRHDGVDSSWDKCVHEVLYCMCFCFFTHFTFCSHFRLFTPPICDAIHPTHPPRQFDDFVFQVGKTGQYAMVVIVDGVPSA